MFDIAYEAEATIEAIEIELNKHWTEWKEKHNLETKFMIYYAFLNAPYIRIKDYWEIILGTHGGK